MSFANLSRRNHRITHLHFHSGNCLRFGYGNALPQTSYAPFVDASESLVRLVFLFKDVMGMVIFKC
jgi:hypothetical protein